MITEIKVLPEKSVLSDPATYICDPGVLTVNLQDFTISVHDGVTPGGNPVGGGGSGTVTSVGVSGGVTGLTTTGGPITGSGTISLTGTLSVAHGGTGTASPGLVAGTNISSITGTWPNQTINAAGGGGGSPGGADTNIQINESGTFGGTSNLSYTYSASSPTFTVGPGGAFTTTIGLIASSGSTVGGALLIQGGNTVSGRGGDTTLQAGSASAGRAGITHILGGNSTGSNQGGQLSIIAGSSITGAGGPVSVVGGSSLTSGTAGAVSIIGGFTASGTGGGVNLTGGDGDTGGDITIHGGDAETINGGNVNMNAGASAGSGSPGSVTITGGGIGVGASGTVGGDVLIVAGPTGGGGKTPGNIIMKTGDGTSIMTLTANGSLAAKIGVFSKTGTPVVQPTVSGSRGGNVALASLLTALAALGWIIDSSS